MKRIAVIVTIVVGGFSILGGLWAFDCAYTRASDHRQLKQRFERQLLMDDARNYQRRMWDMERFYGPDKARKSQEYLEIQNEREMILLELQRK